MDRGQPTDIEYIFPFLRNFWKHGYTVVSQPQSYKAVRQVSAVEDMKKDETWCVEYKTAQCYMCK